MDVEIVSHCWKYSKLQMYQLSSILTASAESDAPNVTLSLFFALADQDTVKLVEFFDTIQRPNPARVTWRWRPLPHPELTNRAIGRNLAAKGTKADVVWFADADYCVMPGFWKNFHAVLPTINKPLWYPRTVSATTHERGQEAIRNAAGEPRLLHYPARDLIEQSFRKAIGGVQFVLGDTARAKGYLDGQPKQLRPYTSGNWRANVEDQRYRKSLGTPGQAVDMRGLLRIRHGERGGPEKVVNF